MLHPGPAELGLRTSATPLLSFFLSFLLLPDHFKGPAQGIINEAVKAARAVTLGGGRKRQPWVGWGGTAPAGRPGTSSAL